MTSTSGELTAVVVYIGYGVTAPKHNYDDYKWINVKGKIVLMNRDVFFKNSTDPEYTKWVKYCYHQYKLENSVKHGAAGMLYIGGNHANPNISYDPNFIWCGIGPKPLKEANQGFLHRSMRTRQLWQAPNRWSNFQQGWNTCSWNRNYGKP